MFGILYDLDILFGDWEGVVWRIFGDVVDGFVYYSFGGSFGNVAYTVIDTEWQPIQSGEQ